MALRERIAVIGAGLMGHGIAQVFASHGHEVTIFDPSATALDSVKDRVRVNLSDLDQDLTAVEYIHPCTSLAESVASADFIVEAAIEDLAAKQRLFVEVEAAAPANAILASNTSVISISRIMEKLANRTRTLGTHWWNPPFLVPLVEVIGTPSTAPEIIERTLALHRSVGKTAVHVRKDVPGFVGNRMQHALWREAISLVEHGICDADTVDQVVKSSFGLRLPILGPLENADLIGTDLTLAIHNNVLGAIERSTEPSPYLEDLVATGKLGTKSGEGFRKWTPTQTAQLRDRVFNYLKQAQSKDA